MNGHMSLIYDPIAGFTCPDEQIEAHYNEYVRLVNSAGPYDPCLMKTGSELFVQRARLGLMRDEIKSLTVYHDGTAYECKKGYMDADYWRSHTNHWDVWVEELVLGRHTRKAT